jgi:hypothetical protein
MAPVLISIVFFRAFPLPYKILGIHLWGAALSEIICHILWYHKINNLFMFPLYTLWEFEMVSLFYFMVLKSVSFRRIIVCMMILFAALTVADICLVNGLKRFNYYSRSVEGLIIIMYTVTYFYTVLSEMSIARPEKEGAVWISMAFLIYFSGTLFLFIFGDYVIRHSYKTYGVYWVFHAVLMWILCSMIATGLWHKRKA